MESVSLIPFHLPPYGFGWNGIHVFHVDSMWNSTVVGYELSPSVGKPEPRIHCPGELWPLG